MKSEYVRARIDPAIKAEALEFLDEMGMSPSQAINMLFKHLAREHEWPLPLRLPNAETRKVFEDTDKGIGLKEFKNLDDFFKNLEG